MGQRATTYRAVQAVAPGKLELVQKPFTEPPPGHVRIRVEACGVCHSDSATVEGILPIQWPRVPGHEAVGRIDAIGEDVQGWAVGQRVGVGFLGGSCGYCEYCRDGDLVNCKNQSYTGVQQDGGYAESMIAKTSGLMSVPDDLSSVDAAPLLCARPHDIQRSAKLPRASRRSRRHTRSGRAGAPWRAIRSPHGLRGRRNRSWRRRSSGTREKIGRAPLCR